MYIPANEFSLSDKAFWGSPHSFADNLAVARAAGFTHLHFSTAWTRPEPLSPDEGEEYAGMLRDAGIRVLDVHGCHAKQDNNLWQPEPEAQAAGLVSFRARIALTKALGGDGIVYHVPTRIAATDAVLRQYADHLAALIDEAGAMGIRIALENHYDRENDRRTLEYCFARFSPAELGFTFDPGHALISGNTEWLLKYAMDRLHILHLNDNDTTRDQHLVPGDSRGKADWAKILPAIATSPYTKPIQLEVSYEPDGEDDFATFIGRAAKACRDLISAINDAAENQPSPERSVRK